MLSFSLKAGALIAFHLWTVNHSTLKTTLVSPYEGILTFQRKQLRMDDADMPTYFVFNFYNSGDIFIINIASGFHQRAPIEHDGHLYEDLRKQKLEN